LLDRIVGDRFLIVRVNEIDVLTTSTILKSFLSQALNNLSNAG
jgi:hypothetical protein